MNWETHKKLLLRDRGVRNALKKTRVEYDIARTLILARMKRKMTQSQLAKKMRTKQSVISRVENAQTVPTISFLKRLAHVFNATLTIQFK